MSSPRERSGLEPDNDEVDSHQQTTSGEESDKHHQHTSLDNLAIETQEDSQLSEPVSPGPSEPPQEFLRSQVPAAESSGGVTSRTRRRLDDRPPTPGYDNRHYSSAVGQDEQLFIYHEQRRRLALAKKYKLDLTTVTCSHESGLVTWDGFDKAVAQEEADRNTQILEAEQRQ